jgi:GT2 family glycosyltransferase
MHKAYIVVVSYNGTQDTIECLESVLKLNHSNFQVIVIDNSLTTEPIENLEAWAKGTDVKITTPFEDLVYPPENKPLDYAVIAENDFLHQEHQQKLLFVKANHNNGFAAANNIGLRYIMQYGDKEALIWLLNNDTVVEKNTLALIVEGIEEKVYPDTLLFGTPLLEYYAKGTIQALGGKYNKYTGTGYHVAENEPVPQVWDPILPNTVDYPVGASMLIKQGFLKKVGLMNEEYFLYYEELDWVYRAKKQEGYCVILPVYGVYHKQGASTVKSKVTKKSEFIDLLSLKNRLLFARKYNKDTAWMVALFILGVTVPRRILQGNFKIVPKIVRLVFA